MRFIKKAAIVALVAVIAFTTAYNTFPHVYAASAETVVLNGEDGLISGIVRENNPSLGYLTVYLSSDKKADPSVNTAVVRNFTYGYDIVILRDGIAVTADNIQPGDKVFLELDAEGYIGRLSAGSWYKPVYGTVHLKSASGLIVKNDSGVYIHYPLTNNIPVFKNGKPLGISDIQPGDRIRLLAQTDGENIDIAGIDIEKNPKPVSGIYRGNIEFFDKIRDSLVLSGVQEFVNGRWENTRVIGIQSFGFNSDYKVRPSARTSGTAYFAVKKSSDGSDKIVVAGYRSEPKFETTAKDYLLSTDSGRLELENSSDFIKFDQDTIVIKDGKLVDVSALNTLDPVRISMEKPVYGSTYLANILISESTVDSGPVIYRGRIKSVKAAQSLTVESFAKLNGVTWEFTNTPKTFDINLNVSRLLDEDGIGNMREFDSDYAGKSVYIIAEGTEIQLISLAPYAENPVSGRISDLYAGTAADSEETLSDPASVTLTNAMIYDTDSHRWKKNDHNSLEVPVLDYAVVVKKGQVGTISLLKRGDEIRIMRHAQSDHGVLIICE
ncbi:MAG TPA: hypothetical protein DD738_02080 [Ruminiclostridium sp.]|nr:hypothetical protein [Ruminiclostridium sp.]